MLRCYNDLRPHVWSTKLGLSRLRFGLRFSPEVLDKHEVRALAILLAIKDGAAIERNRQRLPTTGKWLFQRRNCTDPASPDIQELQCGTRFNVWVRKVNTVRCNRPMEAD